MSRSKMAPLAPLETHATDVIARSFGRTLALWPDRLSRPGPSGARVEYFCGFEHLDGTYDSMISIGQLGTAPNLVSMLAGLRPHLAARSILNFCEPTIATDAPTTSPPHDVTTTLWAQGFTVIECRRFRARTRLRTHEYCWGRARLTPPRP